MDSRRKLAVALLVLGLGVAAALAAFYFQGSTTPAERARAWLPKSEGAGSSETAAPTAPSADGTDEEFSFGDFLDVLGAEAMRPEVKAVAAQFAKEFMAEPALRDVYREFARDRAAGRRRTAREFLDRLGKAPEFHRLEAKFAESQATTAAVLALYESAALGKFWKKQEQEPAENPLIARVRRLAKSLSLRFHDPVGRAGPQALTAGLRGGPGTFSSGGASGFGTTLAAAGTVGAEAGGIEGAGAPAGAPTSLGSGPNSHDVASHLGILTAADTDPMAIFCSPEKFKWLCDFLSPGERQSMFGAIDRDGLWGACWKLQLFDKCMAACGASNGHCSQKSGWNSCLEAHDNAELACVAECRVSPYTQWCTVPDDVKSRLCSVAWPAGPPSECGDWGHQTGVPSPPGGSGCSGDPDSKPACDTGPCSCWHTVDVNGEWLPCGSDDCMWNRTGCGDCACQGGSCHP